MSSDKANRELAAELISRLRCSERGTACLAALDTFLRQDATYSLDLDNRSAVVLLVTAALATPSVREMLGSESRQVP